MTVPAEIAAAVETAVSAEAGRRVQLTSARAVGGGCISPSARIELDRAPPGFLKWAESASTPTELFTAEAYSLAALGEAGAVRVPHVRAVAERWLLLEWLEPGQVGSKTWAELGRGLAALHGVRQPTFGWAKDNFIGSLTQTNRAGMDWAVFWREQRLEPQLRLASARITVADRRHFDRLLERLGDALAPAYDDGPSLLHGDLWGGNVHVLEDGAAALVDPSSYYGHREVDLAMAELFGGFGAGFREAYDEAWPLSPGYREIRRPIYQLYYLLVHVTLFGAGYVVGTRAALNATLAALG